MNASIYKKAVRKFWLNGSDYRQNYRIWGSQNPDFVVQASPSNKKSLLGVVSELMAFWLLFYLFRQLIQNISRLLENDVLRDTYHKYWIQDTWFFQQVELPDCTFSVIVSFFKFFSLSYDIHFNLFCVTISSIFLNHILLLKISKNIYFFSFIQNFTFCRKKVIYMRIKCKNNLFPIRMKKILRVMNYLLSMCEILH